MSCHICSFPGFGRCQKCFSNCCPECLDAISCLSCKFEIMDKFFCMRYFSFRTKPKFLFLPLIINKIPLENRKLVLSTLEHLFYCKKGCTMKNLETTVKCGHYLTTLYHKKKKYDVFHLRNNYYRMLDGTIWIVPPRK